MSKKLFLAIGLAIAIIFSFSVTLSFATENTMQNAGNDVVNGVRDVVGGAENAVEDALKGVGDGINDMTNMETLWIDDEKTRNKQFKTMLKSGKCEDLIKLIFNKRYSKSISKKLNKADKEIIKEAERLLNEEFAVILNISPNEVNSYISSQIS